jgi:gag-polypeptide of LTR copia-type/Zinc knuckle
MSDKKEAMRSWDKEDKVAHQLLTQQLPDEVSMEVQDLKTVKAQWDTVKLEFSARSKHAKNNLKQEFLDMRCPRGGDIWAFLTSLWTKWNKIQAAGAKISDDEYKQTILWSIPGELAKFASNMQTAAEISNTTLTMTHLIQSISEEANHMKSHRTYHQQGPGKGKNVDTTDEALAVTSSSGSCNRRRKRRPGNCHNCGKAGHWARECCAPKKDESADTQSGQASPTTSTPKPDNKSVGSANTVAYMDNEGDGFWMVEEANEEVAPVHTVSVEPDLILYAPDDLEVPPADLDSLEEPFWGDDSEDWSGAEGGEWDLEEVANMNKEGAEVAITPTARENICSEPSAQLEGEETKSLTVRSEQPAAQSTPTTSCIATPSVTNPSMAPGHESLPTSAPLQPWRSAHVRSPPCTEHDLQADEGITPMHGLQSPDLDSPEDAKGAGGAYATAVAAPELPGDAEEAGGVLAAIVEMPKPPEEAEEAGGACATIADMPKPPEDPEGPEHALMAETVDTEALEAGTPAEDKHIACPVAQVPSQLRSLDLDDPAVPVAYLASFCTPTPMVFSPRLESQQIGIRDVYLDDVLNKNEAVLSTQQQFSHKSHDPGMCVLRTVKVNTLHGLKPHGRHWQQQSISEIFPPIQVQQVPTGPGPYPQVVLLQTEPEPFTHQSTSHLDSSQILLTHVPMPKDNPVVPSSSIDHGDTQISSGNDPYHGCEATARPYARLAPHPLACPELPLIMCTSASPSTGLIGWRSSVLCVPHTIW